VCGRGPYRRRENIGGYWVPTDQQQHVGEVPFSCRGGTVVDHRDELFGQHGRQRVSQDGE
jgi:hypothetical protein